MKNDRARQAERVSWVGLGANAFLALLKLSAGFAGNSAAMIADGVNSLSDLGTDIVAVVSFRITGRPIDRSHGYGHGKFETLATAIIGSALLAVAVGIFFGGGERILTVLRGGTLPRPGLVALAAAAVSILIKETLYIFTRRAALSLSSDALMATAWDHRSDALASMGAMVGIGGAIFLGPKARVLDPLAALVVAAIILRIAFPITVKSLSELLEGSLSRENEEEIMQAISEVPGVEGAHHLRTRKVGSDVAVEVHIIVARDLGITEAHNIATEVESAIRALHGEGTFVSVHPEPESGDLQGQVPFDDGHNGMEDGPGHHERVPDDLHE